MSLQRPGTVGWSVVCDRVISWSYSFAFLQACQSDLSCSWKVHGALSTRMVNRKISIQNRFFII